MTKVWEREFAVSRMREDPTISYRALAKVLNLSDSTVRQWRDEEGIPPRPHHNTGRRRNGTRSASGRPRPLRPIIFPARDQDGDRHEDEEELEDDRPWVDDLEDAEFEVEDEDEDEELDDAPATSRAASLAQTWETIGRLGGLKLPGLRLATPGTSRRGSPRATPTPTPETDPRERLRAISAELDARSPRGSEAARLLVEAASYLVGGVIVLPQYGEAHGCRPEDVAGAVRRVLGKGMG